MTAIHVVMTVHNRRETTVGSVGAILREATPAVSVVVYVTDDGSTDGTAEALAEFGDAVRVQTGNGQLYWAGGMALAERRAVEDGPDYLLWLNDDTVLHTGALGRLLSTSSAHPETIVVGAVVDPHTGESTYGGRVRIDYHPQRLRRLPISDHPQRADTFNGNVVLIPWSVRERVGPIDGQFPHSYADDDYGLRATALGVPIIQAAGSVATCPRNPAASPLTGGPVLRWRRLQHPKALPWRAQARYLRRHGDWRWPVILAGQQVSRALGRLP